MGEEIGVDVGVYNQAKANVFMRGNNFSIPILIVKCCRSYKTLKLQ